MEESWCHMVETILIGLSAALGAVVRYLFSQLNVSFKKIGFPIGTYLVNIIGCLLIGWLFGHFGNQSDTFKIFATGFCGGLTTFSTYNFELFDLIDHKDYRHFAEYFLLSYGLGFVALVIGLMLAK
ncbi:MULTISPECIES: fluoride efflux transporter CrcB [unclassified Lactococcus]|nr:MULTISPECIES: fluoride efflux transporter CrcB [unclassified Lactococcus]